MNRYFFTITALFKNRSLLQRYCKDSHYSCNSVTEITPELLAQKDIAVLVLDIDGVLSAHDAKEFPALVIEWLHRLQKEWPHPIYIFSNRPSASRQQFFNQGFPEIKFIKGVARKPYPDGLLLVAKQTGVPKKKILMVDDRLLTGVLAAVLAGCQALWIRKPYQNFKINPVREAWFHCLRLMDRILLQ